MNKLHIAGLLAFLMSFGAFAQYDGAPMEKTAEAKKAKPAVRTNKYPHSDNDWENFDVLHINRLPSAATFLLYSSKEKAIKNDKNASEYYMPLNLSLIHI